MRKHLLPNNRNFYKANMHVHSTVSDGEMTPEELKRIYTERGYSVVAFTDHEVMVPHPDLTDDNFLAITSTEISINERVDCDFHFTKTYHLNIYSPEEGRTHFGSFDRSKMWLKHSYDYITSEQENVGMNRVYTTECINEIIRNANADGCLVSYNHPVWSLQDYSDYIDLKGLWGVELYNTGCARNGYIDSAKPLDDMLRVGERVMPLATDDAHKLRDCFGGYLMIAAENLSYDVIFSALRSGDFYASCGPEIHEISIDEGIVRVKSSPVSYINLSTDTRLLFSKNNEHGSQLTDVELDIKWYLDLARQGINEHRYIRITLIDDKGNYAYSRAYFIEELI